MSVGSGSKNTISFLLGNIEKLRITEGNWLHIHKWKFQKNTNGSSYIYCFSTVMHAWFSYPKKNWLYSQADVATERNYHILGFLLSLRKNDLFITLPRTWDFISHFSWILVWYLNYTSQLKLSDVKGEIKFNFKDFHGHWNSQRLIFEVIFLLYLYN